MVENLMKNIREMPKDERLKEPTKEELVTALRVIRYFAAKILRGDTKALPLELYESIEAIGIRPAVEIIMTDEQGRYALIPRPANDSEKNKQSYGEGTLYIPGGMAKPDRKGGEHVGPIATAIRMAREKTGLDIVPVSGPIAMYQWTRTKEHPTGWPLSLAFVFKVAGGTPKEDIQWFDPDTLPPQDELLKGNAGEIHRGLIEAYQAWRKDPTTFVDLNEKFPPAV